MLLNHTYLLTPLCRILYEKPIDFYHALPQHRLMVAVFIKRLPDEGTVVDTRSFIQCKSKYEHTATRPETEETEETHLRLNYGTFIFCCLLDS